MRLGRNRRWEGVPWRRLALPLAIVLLVGALAAWLLLRPPAPELEVAGAASVGREPIGLALASDGSTLYVANAADGTVSALEAANPTARAATFRVSSGRLNSLAVSPSGRTLYATEVDEGRLYALDLPSGEARGSASVGDFPQGVVVSPDGARVYTADTGSNSVSVVDAASLTRLSSLPTGEKPYALAWGPLGRLYVSTSVRTIDVLDPAAGVALEPLDFGEVTRLLGLAVSPDGRAYAADGLTDLVLEHGPDGVRRLPPGNPPGGGEFSPTDVALSNDGSRLYVVGRSGFLGVVDPRSRRVVQTLQLGGDLRQVALGPDGRVYATDFAGNRVVVARPVGTGR